MEGYRHGLTDEQWTVLDPLLREVGGSRSRRPLDNRRWIDAILWLGKTGCPWRDLPADFGKWRGIHDRFMDWSKSGRWERLFGLSAGTPDATALFMDSTVIKAAPCAAGALKKAVHLRLKNSAKAWPKPWRPVDKAPCCC